jgi:tetratricopeptide (TPR) repeat protein
VQIRLLVYAAVGLLLSALPRAAGAQSPATVCQLALNDYRVALQSYQDGLFDPAFAGFESYLLHCPLGDYVGQAHYLLAEMLAQQSACDKALAHVKEALAQPLASPLRPHVLFLGARCALQLKQSALAQTYLQDSVASPAPGDIKAPAFYWLGELALQQQHYDEAKRYYARTLQEAPKGEYAAHAHYSLGFIAQQEGDIDAALRAFDAFLKLAPDHPSAARVRFIRADLWRQNGQLKEAAAAFKTLSRTLSGAMQEESLFRWAELAYALENYPEAQTAYQRLIQTFPQSQHLSASLYGLGWSALRQNQCQAAVTPWEQFVALPLESVTPGQVREVHYHLGICYLELEDPPRARQHLRQVTMSGEDSMEQREAVVKVAALAYQAGDFDEAVAFYTRALTTAEDRGAPRLHFLLGESYQAKGEMEQAITHWQQALKGSPDLPFYAVALDRLGRAYMAKHDWGQAISRLRRLWDDFPNFPERSAVALELAQAYSHANECEAALPFFAFLGTSAQGQAALRGLRHSHAACLFATGRYEDVVALLTPLLTPGQSDTIDPTLLYTLGQAHMELHQFEAAITPFRRLQTEFPEHPLRQAMLPRLAYAFEQVGRPGDALDTWKAHVKAGAERNATARLRLQLHMGRLALQAKRFEDALALLPKAHKIAATDMAVETLFWRAEAYYELQQWDAAKQWYQALLEHYGASRWGDAARLRLGTVYEQQQEWDLALETYRTLRDTATDAEMIANAVRRIAAIEAGLVRSRPQTAPSLGKTPPSSEG